MPLDLHFFTHVESIRRVEKGTEHMAPLLYQLIRSTRPQQVLEIGMGYSTPFLAQALADNMADIATEQEQLIAKTRDYVQRRETDASLPECLPDARQEWLWQAPALVDPRFYQIPYQPSLHAIDDFQAETSSAPNAPAVVRQLDLDHLLSLHQGDFRTFPDQFRTQGITFDFVWFDCGGKQEYADFLELYWPLITADGGMLVIHRPLTNRAIGSVINDLRQRQHEQGDFEMVCLLEPHKVTQNSFAIVRKTGSYKERFYEEEGNAISADALTLLG